MLDTLTECVNELNRIDHELSRLNIERAHIVNVMNFLEKNPPPPPKVYVPKNNTLAGRIYEIVKNNPGISGVDAFKLITTGETQRQVSYSLSNLRTAERIENHGGSGRTGSWYIKEK